MQYCFTFTEIQFYVLSYCDLVVTFDCKISFINHIQIFKNQSFIIRNSCGFYNISIRILLLKSFVRFKLEHSSSIRSPCYWTHIDPLKRTQRKFFNFLLFVLMVYISYSSVFWMTHCCILFLLRFSNISNYYLLIKMIHFRTDCSEILALLSFHVLRLSARSQQRFYLNALQTNLQMYSPVMKMCSKLMMTIAFLILLVKFSILRYLSF